MNKKLLNNDLLNNNSFFKEQKTIFQRKINNLLETPEKNSNINIIIESLIKLQWYKKFNSNLEEADNLIKLQNYLGLDKFADLLELLGGKVITIPSKKDFKETILIALCYYYRYILNKKWSEIKTFLNDPEFPVIRYKSKIKKIQNYLETMFVKLKDHLQKTNNEKLNQN